jgi:amino acid transporter
MNNQTHTQGDPKPFAIIGLVLAIISLLFSFIPCVGTYATGPAILAFMFSAICFFIYRARKEKNVTCIAGMVVSVLAISFGIYQYITFSEVFKAKEELTREVREAEDKMAEKLLDTLLNSKPHHVKDTVSPAAKDTTGQW